MEVQNIETVPARNRIAYFNSTEPPIKSTEEISIMITIG